MVDFRLYLITDRHRCEGRRLASVLQVACEAGVRAVQLREKDLSTKAFWDLAEEIYSLVEGIGARLLINDRADIAGPVGAFGVHLPENGMPVPAARKAMGGRGIIGVSTHDPDKARRAEDEGADFVTYGPVYFTPSKAAYGEPVGLQNLETVTRLLSIPVFAIGGILPNRVKPCVEAGAHGVAVISGILSAPDVMAAVKEYRNALGEDRV